VPPLLLPDKFLITSTWIVFSTLNTGLSVCKATTAGKKAKKIPVTNNGEVFQEIMGLMCSAINRLGAAGTGVAGGTRCSRTAFRFGACVAVALLIPAIAFKGKPGNRNGFFSVAATLDTFRNGLIRKFLAHFKPVTADFTLIFVYWHEMNPPSVVIRD